MGRDIRTRSELGIESRTEYAPLVSRTWDGGQTDDRSDYEHTPVVKELDGLGRLVRAAQTLGGAELDARFTYDPLGRLRSKTDPEGNVARYDYDGQGRRTLVDDPDLGRRTFVYDRTGNLIERRNPDGSVLEYTFDLAGRPLTEDWNGDGTPEVTKTWDARPGDVGDVRYRGKLAHIADPTGTTEHEYDHRGRITWTHVTIDGHRYSSGSQFDDLDREVLHVYPDGSSIRIHRNARGQLSGYGEAVTISYDGDGLESERRFNTGVLVQSAYDTDRRFDELAALAADGTTIEHLKWTFDGAGNVTSLQDLRPDVAKQDDRTESYAYDNLYRLRVAVGRWGRTAWDYSSSGNLTRRTSDVPNQSAEGIRYGEGAGPHALTAINGRALHYDRLGRLLDDGDRAYTWNEADQLTRVTNRQGASVENAFDANGVRRVRTEQAPDGRTSTVHFISPWSEVRDGKLVRYIVHTERRIARLSDANGLPASAAPVVDFHVPPRLLLLLARTGQLALTLALAFALLWTMRRALQRTLRVLVPVAGLALLAACGSSDSASPSAAPDLQGSVRMLTDADTILITDQLGSVLAETSGTGHVTGRFASYPYGVTRYDSSHETRQYAGAIRDQGIGLDLMGARFYAPDLGVWTAGDPVAINDPERSASEQFGTANPYAYANLNPVTAIDPDGEFWHIVAGAAIGAILGGGIEAARQYVAHGKVEDWGRVGAAAAGGAVSGTVQAALPGAGTAAMLGVGAASGAAGGVTERLVESGGKSAGSVTDVVIDAAVGAATAGIVKGASSVVKKIRAPKPKPPPAAKPASKVEAVTEGSMCPCFAAETVVATLDGPKPIAQIQVGELVLARDPDTGKTAYKPVTTVFVTPGKPLVELRVQGDDGNVETIHATPGHPFWVEGRGWTDAAALGLGDALSTSTNGEVELVAAGSLPDVRTVYNLEVADFHTYFVGEATAWVHNQCGCGGGGAGDRQLPERIYRAGGKNPSNLKARPGEDGLSFRDSLSNPLPRGERPVFRPGDKYIEVDTSKLPSGSVIPDNAPPGHVTVTATSEQLQKAIVSAGKFPQ